MQSFKSSIVIGNARTPPGYKLATGWCLFTDKNERHNIPIYVQFFYTSTQAHTYNHSHTQTQKSQCLMYIHQSNSCWTFAIMNAYSY